MLLDHLFLKLFCLAFHFNKVFVFPLQLCFFLAIDMSHLIFEEVLDLLVFAELDHLIVLGIHAMLALVFLDNVAPKLVLSLVCVDAKIASLCRRAERSPT